MLRGLGLDLPGATDDRYQRQVHVDTVASAQLHSELPNSLEERQRLDITHRAADLDHAHVRAVSAELDAALDLIGDVRNHLHGRAKIITAPLFRDHTLVDAAGGEVTVAARGGAHESFVVTEIQIGFGAVLGDEHFAVLERAHGARIYVDVGVELDHGDLEAAGLENRTE